MKVPAVSVCGFIASLNVALTDALIGTPTAFATGPVVVTVGAVVSAAVPVVNVQLNALASALFAASLTPVVMLAVQRTPVGNAAVGVNVATFPVDP